MGLISRVSSRTYRKNKCNAIFRAIFFFSPNIPAMTSNSVFQLQNYKDMVDDTQKQLRSQKNEFESFQKTWGDLAGELLMEVEIDIDQIAPEFRAALGHMQKGINVQEAYHKKLQTDCNKVTQVSNEIQEKPADDANYDGFLNEKRKELT